MQTLLNIVQSVLNIMQTVLHSCAQYHANDARICADCAFQAGLQRHELLSFLFPTARLLEDEGLPQFYPQTVFIEPNICVSVYAPCSLQEGTLL
jgi:hypothetical protein